MGCANMKEMGVEVPEVPEDVSDINPSDVKKGLKAAKAVQETAVAVSKELDKPEESIAQETGETTSSAPMNVTEVTAEPEKEVEAELAQETEAVAITETTEVTQEAETAPEPEAAGEEAAAEEPAAAEQTAED